MRFGNLVFRSAMLFSLATTSALAVNHNVAVGQNSQGINALAFNPSSLTINAGDTVTFTNNSGGFHNAHSTGGPAADAFQCSVNCASNNTPNSSAWSDIVTFTMAGTVTYQCDQHGGMGMTGTITVQALPVRLQSFDVE
jgi:plastocyanin